MTDERKPADEAPVEAWDDAGGAAERDDASSDAAHDEEDRAKRWSDERTGHWHGATSSDATQHRAEDE